MRSRCEIMLENYCKIVAIESQTMVQMVKNDVLPAASKYRRVLAETINAIRTAMPEAEPVYEAEQLRHLSALTASAYEKLGILEESAAKAKSAGNIACSAEIYKTDVLGAMEALRQVVDEMEVNTASEFWPYPSYGEMLFSIR